MKLVVRFTAEEELRALRVLLRHSPGSVLPERTYILEDAAVRELQDAGVTFTEVTSEANAPSLPETERYTRTF